MRRLRALRGCAGPEATAARWSDIEKLARCTLVARDGHRSLVTSGAWSGTQPGEHTIDIQFHAPITLRRLRVVCEETAVARTQRLTIWATLHRGERHRELVRQTFTFTPDSAPRAIEDHEWTIEQVSGIQLRIVPDIDGRAVRARIVSLQLVAD